MMLCDALNVCGCVVPPLLREQEALVHRVEGPALPGLTAKAGVLRKRLDTVRAGLVRARADAILKIARPFVGSFPDELNLLVGREQQMLEPVGVSLRQGGR